MAGRASIPSTPGEILRESLYAGVLGGSAVALFYLIVDLVNGQPLFTPSMIGQVLFQGVSAAEVTEVKLGAVAAFSVVHMLAFTALGGALSFVVHEVELHSRHPIVAMLVIFVIIEAAFFAVVPFLFPGVTEPVAVLRIGAANLLAAGTMALFFMLSHRAGAWQKVKHTTPEFILDSLYSGVLGGSAVALFYLIVDLLNGQPLFTPSMIGQVLFQGVSAAEVTEVKLGAVAAFSVVHMLAFTALGGALSFLVHKVELHARHPIEVLLVLFAIIEVAFFAVVPFLFPGVTEPVAILRIGAANLLAAGTMALFFMLSHRAGAWQKVKHTTPEFILDSLYSGVLGGTAVAGFFLVADLLDGQPLFTPSLMGSVLFLDVAAQDVTAVNFGALVYFSLVHLAIFTALGALVTFVVHKVELHARHPIEVLLVLFAIIEVAFFAAAPLAMPGVIEKLGIVRVGIANLLAAGSMAVFFVLYHRSAAREELKHSLADFLFDSFYAGAIGGSAVALFFLAADALDGQPFFTPSLMGSMLFLDVAASDVVQVNLNAVAYFSIVHFASCAVVGTLVTWLVHEVELHSRHPVLVLIVLFAIIEVAFLLLASLAMPGIIAKLGIVRVGIANLLAAGSMSLFFVLSHREKAWEKIKHAAHLA